ncbi:MAG: hypothetical protein PVH24_01135, partial [Candidatus Zixiibacteriota bacterium]
SLSIFIFGLAVVASTVAFFSGCGSEKDVPYVIDEDEIARYLRETEEGQQFFRSDSLILPTPYVTPGDTILYRDSVLAQGTETTVIVDTNRADYGSLGELAEAAAFVLDSFIVRRFRVSDNAIVDSGSIRYLTRVGFFLKLGTDAQAYVGWKLWGFGVPSSSLPGTLPVTVAVTPDGMTPFPGDLDLYTETPKSSLLKCRFIALTDMAKIPGGTRIVVSTQTANSQSPVRYFQLLSAGGSNGFFMEPMYRIDADNYIDTISAPTSSSQLYEVVMIQSFDDSDNSFTKAWTFPYRILQ